MCECVRVCVTVLVRVCMCGSEYVNVCMSVSVYEFESIMSVGECKCV